VVGRRVFFRFRVGELVTTSYSEGDTVVSLINNADGAEDGDHVEFVEFSYSVGDHVAFQFVEFSYSVGDHVAFQFVGFSYSYSAKDRLGINCRRRDNEGEDVEVSLDSYSVEGL